MPIDRTLWYNALVDETGSGNGTLIDKAFIDSLLDSIDALFGTQVSSVTNSNATTPALIAAYAGLLANWQFIRHTTPGGGGFLLQLSSTRGAAADSYTVVQSGDGLGTVNFQGADGSKYVPGAQIIATVDATPGANDMPGRLTFLTTPDGSATPAERMRIDSKGNVGVGATSFGTSAAGIVAIANGTAPSSSPAGMGQMYAEAGAGKWRGSSGTITTFGPAEPHCPTCGRDFVLEWQNERYGHLIVCMWCATARGGPGVFVREP